MSTYQEASNLKAQLTALINQAIENHPLVKSAIKVKKATVDSVNTIAKTVTVRFPFDTSLVTLPYNPQMESYLTTGTVKGKAVSVWFYQSLQNGIVMQDGNWSVSEGSNNLVDMVYPVGSIYMSVNDTSPATLFGGTWEKIEDKFLLGSSSSYTNGSSGGEAVHTLTVTEMPSHYHLLFGGDESNGNFTSGGSSTIIANHNTVNNDSAYTLVGTTKESWRGRSQAIGNTQPHNNMPPYLAVNIWKRTA